MPKFPVGPVYTNLFVCQKWRLLEVLQDLYWFLLDASNGKKIAGVLETCGNIITTSHDLLRL